jgi:dTDP-4-dehydrorhamnose reductase
MVRYLVLGGTGLLGPYLKSALADKGEVLVAGQKSGDIRLNATDPKALAQCVKEVRPDIIFNCIALTDVDACERDPNLAERINAAPDSFLSDILSPSTRLIQVSTDQVYPDTVGPHSEGQVAPINVYGRSKLKGEVAALRHRNTLVLRVNFFGSSRTQNRKSLSDWVIGSSRDGREITLFNDTLFSPLTLSTLTRLMSAFSDSDLVGSFNLGCRDGSTKAQFARQLLTTMGLSSANAHEGPSPSMAERAPRPKDMRMDVGKIEAVTGITLPTLAEEICVYCQEQL